MNEFVGKVFNSLQRATSEMLHLKFMDYTVLACVLNWYPPTEDGNLNDRFSCNKIVLTRGLEEEKGEKEKKIRSKRWLHSNSTKITKKKQSTRLKILD